jgi:hypothetical protein
MKHLTEEQLILYVYDEPLDRSAVEAHLKECECCQTEKASLDAVLSAVYAIPVPERPETYGPAVWQRVRPRLQCTAPWQQTTARPVASHWPRWLIGAAAAALVALALLMGRRFWPIRPAPSPLAISEQARDRVLMASLAHHFQRAEILLTALRNTDAEAGRKQIEVSFERDLARDLVASNRLYEESALRDGKAGFASLLDELNRVLVSVANAPPTISPTEISELREEIQQQGLLFKIRVLDSHLHENIEARTRASHLVD